ncbi:MAG: sulfatase-like hydrolase/transferase, partial [Candidatus Brocadiae bacterium]|nr:sulfatase-like hydrolase/transferase [Candidatus Brocadiia bacterium]
FDPHEPWDPPAGYARLYEPDYGGGLPGCSAPSRTDGLSERQLREIRAAYAGEVTLVDRWVGHLLDALRETGHADDTLVVFTSDHGCMLGEQGQIHKGTNRLRNQVTRVPLLVRHPAGQAAGERVPGFCQHQDIMPTVLSLLGEPIPDRVLGRNIWPGAPGCGAAPDYVVSAFCFHACIRTDRWNYIRPWIEPSADEVARWQLYGITDSQEELYDLKADPRELNNVAAEHQDVAQELSRGLEDHIKRLAPLTGGTIQGVARLGEHMTFDGLPGD